MRFSTARNVQFSSTVDKWKKDLSVPRPREGVCFTAAPSPSCPRAGRVLRGFRPRFARTASRPSARSRVAVGRCTESMQARGFARELEKA